MSQNARSSRGKTSKTNLRIRKRVQPSSPVLQLNLGTTDLLSEFLDSIETAPSASSSRVPRQEGVPLRASVSSGSSRPDFRLAIDFGTTFTTMAWIKEGEATDDISTIENFPGDIKRIHKEPQVPTEILYLRANAGSHAPAERSNSTAPANGRKKASRTDEPSTRQLFGYEVQKHMSDVNEIENQNIIGKMARMKLLLNEDDYTKDARSEVAHQLAYLVKKGCVKSSQDVIRDLLVKLFLHAKRSLVHHGYTNQSTVEIIFCVPVCWSPKANATMTHCIEEALKKAHFGTRDNNAVSNLFMVNEGEAGAIFALRSGFHELKRGESFLLMDCGGGTIELNSFTASHEYPPRLGEEINQATGAMYGASYLNPDFRTLFMEILSSELYLEDPVNNTRIANIIDEDIMPDFESDLKREFQYKDTTKVYQVKVRYLRKSNTDPRIQNKKIVLTYNDMWKIFQRQLEPIGNLMQAQIEEALNKGVTFDKVIAIGGFADSEALRDFLCERLEFINKVHGCKIEIKFSKLHTSAVGVAKGAIMRALDKSNGPKRIPYLSIGIMRHLEYEADIDEPWMQRQKKERSSYDKDLWLIPRTIQWVIKANQREELERVHEEKFTLEHFFHSADFVWKASEVLYASTTCTEDNWQLTSGKNRGKTTKIGEVVFYLTHLRDYFIENMEVECSNAVGDWYKVVVVVQLIMIDRDMKFFVHWNGNSLETSQQSFTMVAAFKPGTD